MSALPAGPDIPCPTFNSRFVPRTEIQRFGSDGIETAQSRVASKHLPAPMASQCLPAIQSRICLDDTIFLGVCGFKVPAIALHPSLIVSWANCLASASDLNLRVARGDLRSPLPRLGMMFARYETYQISGSDKVFHLEQAQPAVT